MYSYAKFEMYINVHLRLISALSVINLNMKIKNPFICLLYARHSGYTFFQQEQTTRQLWRVKSGWQELPVACPYPFSPSVVIES